MENNLNEFAIHPTRKKIFGNVNKQKMGSVEFYAFDGTLATIKRLTTARSAIAIVPKFKLLHSIAIVIDC